MISYDIDNIPNVLITSAITIGDIASGGTGLFTLGKAEFNTLDLLFINIPLNHYLVYFRVNVEHTCSSSIDFTISIDGSFISTIAVLSTAPTVI